MKMQTGSTVKLIWRALEVAIVAGLLWLIKTWILEAGGKADGSDVIFAVLLAAYFFALKTPPRSVILLLGVVTTGAAFGPH